jgi:hypothetical protein
LVEEKSSVRALPKTHKITLISWGIAASAASELRLHSFYAADAEFPYQINVILWALDRAQTLDFSLTKALQTLPSWISH